MLCDYLAYVRLGESITGAHYEKWEHGHLPGELVRSEKDMQAAGELREEEVDYYGLVLKRVPVSRDPDMSGFGEDELAIVESVLHRFGHETAAYLKKLSHREPGWILAEDHELIPYFTVFLPKTGPTESDVRRGEELASLHGWS